MFHLWRNNSLGIFLSDGELKMTVYSSVTAKGGCVFYIYIYLYFYLYFLYCSCRSDKAAHSLLFSCFFIIHLKVIINQMGDTARQLSHLLVFCSSSIMVLVFWCMSSQDKRTSWCSCELYIKKRKFSLFQSSNFLSGTSWKRVKTKKMSRQNQTGSSARLPPSPSMQQWAK